MIRIALLLLLALPSIALAQDPMNFPQYLNFKVLNGASDPLPYYLDSRTQMPANLSLTVVQSATNGAWNAWNAVSCAVPKVSYKGFSGATIPNAADPYDAFSVTPIWVFSRTEFAYQFIGSPYVKAITLPLSYGGELDQCDVYLNGMDGVWGTTTPTPAGTLDLQTVMVHEAGHCLGINHWGVGNVMTGSVVEGAQNRALSLGDVQAFCDRNPVTGGIGSPCLADGGCGTTTVTGLKCVTQPLTAGSAKFCTVGCNAGTGAQCELPLSCQSSTFFSPASNGACLRAADLSTQVGKACTLDNQCNSSVGLCQQQDTLPSGFASWVDGYCFQSCAAGQPTCPPGSGCTDIGGANPICLASCRVGLADCRSGYSCAQTVNGGVCIPSCHGDVDCGDTVNFQCRVCDGLCVARQNSSGQISDPCTQDTQCGAGQFCAKVDQNKPNKLCTLSCGKGCGTCPAGSACHPLAPTNGLFCLRTCTGPGTCPTGTRCASLSTGKACMPPCTSEFDCPVGQACITGECYNPGEEDAGCAFCPTTDSGVPSNPPKKDGGIGPGGTGGCGCSTGGDLAALIGAAAVLLASARRRLRTERAWPPR